LVLVGSRLLLNAREARADSAVMAALSLHAMTRRYRRGFRNDDAAVMADLAVIAQAKLPDEPTPSFFIAAPSGGTWRGAVNRFKDLDGRINLVFGVRTFV
jgi:hypothetical protein